MKKLFLVCITTSLFSLGCKKDTGAIQNTLIGKWLMTEDKIGTGGPGQWTPATPPDQTIEFKSNGSFISSNHSWAETQFQILDSMTIKLWPDSTDDGYILMKYFIDTQAGELLMSNFRPLCIEGCEYKYERIRTY